MVTDRAPWSEAAADWLRGLARAAGPTPLAASLVRRFLACCA
ncbi:class-I glutamine amidotransferase) [Bordetella pertussis]|nr:class-I glutamine amidotransferase) [Bordetella pertussis]